MKISENLKRRGFYSIMSVILLLCILLSTAAGMFSASADTEDAGASALPQYNAYEAAKAQTAREGFEPYFDDENWSVEMRSPDDGKWYSAGDFKKSTWQIDGNYVEAMPDLFSYWDSIAGKKSVFSVYGDKLVMECAGGNSAPTLTFTAPESGTVKLYDPNGGKIGAEADFWTLNDEGEKIGTAIYKNNEKLWPADSDYYLLENGGEISVDFPELSDIKVDTGDKLRIVFMPINNNFGCVFLAPQVDYTETDETIRYNAYKSVAAQEEAAEAWRFYDDAVWKYGTADGWNTENGISAENLIWDEPAMRTEGGWNSQGGALDSIFHYSNWNDSCNSLATYQKKVVLSANGVKASTFNFTAPYTGKVRLYDPNGGAIGAASISPPFWTLDNADEKYGLAIFHNDEKIWPSDGENTEGGFYILTAQNPETDFPDLTDISVSAGDKLRIVIAPISNPESFAYFSFAPQVDYSETAPSYYAVNAVETAVENGSFDGTNWYLEGVPCYSDGNGASLPGDQWLKLPLTAGSMLDNGINSTVPNWLMFEGTTVGAAVYNKSVLLSPGESGVPYAVSLTFEAPKDGTVEIADPAGGTFGSAGVGGPFWTLNESTKVAGIAIYKNDEKLWPQDKDYYELQGKWDFEIDGYNDAYEHETDFPTLSDIEVKAGDKLRMLVIPIKTTWHYIRLAPQISYTSIDMESQKPATEEQEKPLAVYSASDALKKAFEAKELTNSPWKVQGIYQEESDAAFPPMEFGRIVNDGMYILKGFSYDGTAFGMDSFNIADTSLSLAVDGTNRLLIPAYGYANNIGRLYPAITFSVPKTGVIRLHGDDFNPGLAGCSEWGPYYTLQSKWDPDASTVIKMYIYKNNTQIWPTAANENNMLTSQTRNIAFPDINLQVYEGDTLRIIFDSTGYWEFITLSPVVDYISYNNQKRPANDNPVWSFGKTADNDVEWEDFDPIESDDPISDDAPVYTPVDNSDAYNTDITEETKTPGEQTTKRTKKIIRKMLKKSDGNNTVLIVVICVIGVLLLSAGVITFLVIRKKRSRRKES